MYRSYYDNYNTYNYGRNRYNPYSYFDSYYDLLYEYYYGNRRNRNRNRRSRAADDSPSTNYGGATGSDGGRAGGEPSPPEREEAPKEELAKVLTVKKVNNHIQKNTKDHKTNDYEITEERTGENGEKKKAELVLRRGFFFDLTIKFDRPYNAEKDDLRLSFSYGDDPRTTKGTYAEFKIDETGNQKFDASQWGAHLKSKDGNSIIVEVHIPADCIIGWWDMDIKSFSSGKNKEGKDVTLSFTYEYDPDLLILFNPWCKDDGVYMPTEKLLNEYVLNEHGCVFQGSAWQIRAKAWDHAQFSEVSLNAALHILDMGFRRDSPDKGNPVNVGRRLALMVNSSKGGIIQGNWSGKYEDGTAPWVWKGSEPIFEKYMENKQPVKYGQCWVFSALLTSVCRSLGIPCRSVTNFASAHDTEESNTIDTFKDKEGKDISDRYTGDSVWNFHVWNEAYMARPDLGNPKFNGWQVLDATPQEISEGYDDTIASGYTCGPCPVRSIQIGDCRTPYDCGFIFSEVNADKVTWQVDDDGKITKMEINTRSVGKNISTKTPTGQSYPPPDYDRDDPRDRYRDLTRENRDDVTHNYKFEEGSEAERNAVHHAYETARRPRPGVYDQPALAKDVKFSMKQDNNVMIGKDASFEVLAKNVSKEKKTITRITLTASPATYTGHRGKPFFEKEYTDVDIAPGAETTFKATLTFDKYFPHLVEQAGLKLEAYAVVAKTSSEPEQRTLKSHDFIFTKPELTVKGPKEAKVGDTVTYDIEFVNPLSIPMTDCVLEGESSAFRRSAEKKVGTIPANGTMKEQLTFEVRRKAAEGQVLFSLESKEIFEIQGFSAINVA